jgi:hypothetical protein
VLLYAPADRFGGRNLKRNSRRGGSTMHRLATFMHDTVAMYMMSVGRAMVLLS